MSRATDVDVAGLAAFPLPDPGGATDKEGRGRVLVVAGGAWVPGAPVLTGRASLRAGAGKLQLAATPRFVASLGIAMPEAAILEVAGTAAGEITPAALADLADSAARCDALVIGPGMSDEAAAAALTRGLIAAAPEARFVVDAGALTGLDLEDGATRRLGGGLVITPHAGEMAALLGWDKAEVEADPLAAARGAARALGAVCVMKGSDSFIVSPDGCAWRHTHGVVGLATSGSGDVLAGLIGGLLARGASPLTAAVWGVVIHARAGAALTARIGPLGFLAREVVDEIPHLLAAAAA